MIYQSKTLDDGQTIFTVGAISRREFVDSIHPAEDMETGYTINDNVIHNVLRRKFRTECDSALVKWLDEHKAELTYHVDKVIFKQSTDSNKEIEWGFGFKPGCSVESMFILKWI